MKIKKIVKNFLKYLKSGGVVYASVITREKCEIHSGKVVLVTGGTSGFGFAIAKTFLNQGACVIITGRNKEKMDNAIAALHSNKVKGIIWDLSDSSLAKSKLTEANSLFGPINVYVNNAGVWTPKKWRIISEDDWNNIVDINMKGLFFMAKEEALLMESIVNNNNIGKIINITSIEGIRGGFGPYYASKWGANGLTKGLAKELVKKNIVVNAVAPGMAVTEINKNLPKDGNMYLEAQPIGRFVLVEEIAELVSYLASDSANSIVGQVIAIDGGWTLN